MQLSASQLEFLARFSKSPDGRMLVTIYEAKLAEVDSKLRSGEGAVHHQNQGRAQQLSELLSEIAEAEPRLNRSKLTQTRVAA